VDLGSVSGDVYAGTFTVDANDTNPDDSYPVELTAIDGPGNTATESTDLLDLNTSGDGDSSDTAPPEITDAQLIDRENDGDGEVADGDTVEIRAYVADSGSGVGEVTAFPDAFGVENLRLTPESGDLYNATFRVDAANAAADDSYPIEIVAVDDAGNEANETTGLLTLNTTRDGDTGDTTPPTIENATAIDREDGDGNVSDGDLIEVRAIISDASGLNRTGAIADPFGVQEVTLTSLGGDVYNGTFRVNGSAAFDTSGEYRISVGAEDDAGNRNSTFTNTLFLNVSGDEETNDTTPPTITDANAVDIDDDGVVGDGDLIRINATVTDAESTFIDVTARASAFGVDGRTLTDGDGDGVYNGTIQVDGANAAVNGSYSITVEAIDEAGNRNTMETNALQLRTGGSGAPAFELISSDVTHVGGTAPSRTPYLDVFKPTGVDLVQVQLRTSEFGSYDLRSIGVDHSTEFHIEATYNGTNPRVLLGSGRNATWTKGQNANGSWTVSINVTPTSTQGLFPSPATWDGTRQANSSNNETVQLALDPLPGFTSERKDDLDGAVFGTDAQTFGSPEYDATTNSVSVYVAAPHVTVDGANNTGFFDAFLPRALLDEWGVKNASNLRVSAIGRDANPARVENTSAGARLFIPVNYSAGEVTVSAGETDDDDDSDPSTGVLAGTVTNDSGTPLSGVEVNVVNATTGAGSAVTTNATGEYAIEVPAGTYDVSVDGPGYASERIEGVLVEENVTTTVDVSLNETDGGNASSDVGVVTTSDVRSTPGGEVTVAFNVTNAGDSERAYILRLSDVPSGFNVTGVYNDGGVWDGDSWLFETIQPGESRHPNVTFSVPANATGTYAVEAELLANESIVDTARANVTTTVSIERAIDANGNGKVGDFEILNAISLWRTGDSVPGTGGDTIGDFEILDLIKLWRDGAPVS
jgi:hypothetical protein